MKKLLKKGVVSAVALVAVAMLIPAAPAAFASTAGPSAGGTFASVHVTGGDYAWSNPSRASSSDGSYATADLTNSGNQTENLKATNFGFAIPSNATVNGITVNIERHQTCLDVSCTSHVTDVTVRLMNATGTIVGTNKASTTAWGTSDVTATYGSASDTWSAGLHAADINDAHFGVVLAAERDSGHDRRAYVDYMSITVDYTVPKSDQTITVTSHAPSSAIYGSTFAVAATASSGLPVDITTSGGCSISSGTVTMTSGVTDCVVHYNQAGNDSYNPAPEVTETATAQQQELTITGVTAHNKVYDRTTDATLDTSGAALVGVVGEDAIVLDPSAATGVFDTRDIGTGKTVTISGFVITGAAAGNYSLTQPGAAADITARPLTVSATGFSKVYDGTTDASTAVVLSTDAIAGDTVTPSGSANFEDPNVGTAKPVHVTGIAIGGADAGNYSLVNTSADTTADITEQSATIVLDTSNLTRTYDGTPQSVAVTSTDPSGLPYAVTYNGLPTPPTLVGDYSVHAAITDPNYSGHDDAVLTINQAPLTITPSDQTKVYGDVFTFAGTEFTRGDLYGTDTLTSVTLTSAGVPASAPVSGSPYEIHGSTPVGTGLDNYNIGFNVGHLTVTKAPLVVTPDNKTKTFGDVFTAFTGTLATVKGEDDITADYASDGATSTAPIGSYDITATLNDPGERLDNYDVTMSTGTLAVVSQEEGGGGEGGGGGGTPGGNIAIAFFQGGGGPQGSQGGGTGGGQVLGAATSTPGAPTSTEGSVAGVSTSTCGAYLSGYLGMGRTNESDQVKRLQAFLNLNLGLSLAVNGTFDEPTFLAVKALQVKYYDFILKPWETPTGPHPFPPTGFVGKYTLLFINQTQCGTVIAPSAG